MMKTWAAAGVGDGCGDGLGLGSMTGEGAALGLGVVGALVATLGEHAANRHTPIARASHLIPTNEPTIAPLEHPVSLRAASWEVAIRPRRGGRVTSLKLRGEELLDQGIGVDDGGADGFVESGAWGWDEMVPNVDATAALPDHGEAWRLPWEVLRATADEVEMRCRGRLVPWELVRVIRLDERLTASYTYRNAGAELHMAYWCAHPLFRFEPDMQIGVPGDLTRVAEGASAKHFLPPGSIDRALLRWRSGAAIELSWDRALTPYVGIWVCNGDLGGYRQVAIEPATGGGDQPNPAAPAPLLAPGETYRWWLQIRPV